MIFEILVLFIFIVIILFVCDYCYVHYSKAGRLIDQIPGMKRYPIVGNIFQIQGYSLDGLWRLLRNVTDQYYPITRIWGFYIGVVSIRHPDDLEMILNNTKHIDKGLLYYVLFPWLNTGLLTSTGAKWHSRRRILTPTFHFSILRQFVEILVDESTRMTQKLKGVGGAVEIDLLTFVSEHTLNAICETAMGTSLHSLGEAQKKYRQDILELGHLLVYRLIKPWFFFDLLFSLSPAGRLQKKVLRNLHGFTEKIIAERKLYHKHTNNKYLQKDDATETNDAEIYGNRKKRFAMLDLLIAASQENNLSDLDIKEEVDTFMFEGHDTTAMAICFTLLLLAEHKSIQDRVREEVNTVMERCDEKLTITSLQNLPYLDRCLKESLRLYPSVHFIARVTENDVKLSSNNSYIIPARTVTHLNIYSVHRDPNFWPNPDVFDPDRFLPEKIQKRHPYSYIPFSAGPRNCIGQRFAMLEMKAMIASLMHNFYLEPIDRLKDVTISLDIILRPNHPLNVRFIPIKTA